jgi:hypothetical protein
MLFRKAARKARWVMRFFLVLGGKTVLFAEDFCSSLELSQAVAEARRVFRHDVCIFGTRPWIDFAEITGSLCSDQGAVRFFFPPVF